MSDNSSGFDGNSTHDSQRFKIDIHEDAVDKGDKKENDATLTRVASLLRDVIFIFGIKYSFFFTASKFY